MLKKKKLFSQPSYYYVAFDTRSMPGYLVSVKVSICNDVHPATDEKLAINLADHPLYKDLQAYVLKNPR